MGIALGVALTGSAWVWSNAQQKENTDVIGGVATASMLGRGTASEASRRPSTPEELAAFRKGRADFINIQQLESQSEAVSRLLPYLRHPVEELRAEAVRMLGRLEDPAAEQPLAELVAELDAAIAAKTYVKSPIPPPVPLRMALARIRTRQLKGEKRLEAVAASVGITQDELIEFTQRVNGPKGAGRWGSPASVVVKEFVDLMYMMAKRGEGISDWTKRLTFRPVQTVMFQTAPLPLKQEIDLILDSFDNLDVLMDHEGELPTHEGQLTQRILDAGPAGADLLIQRLEHMRANPELYRQRKTSVPVYKIFFHVAVQTRDSRVLPLLKEFEANPKPWPGIREAARQAREQMEQ